jgi:hypothetical protein
MMTGAAIDTVVTNRARARWTRMRWVWLLNYASQVASNNGEVRAGSYVAYRAKIRPRA